MEVYCWHLRKRQFLEKIPPYTKKNHPHYLFFQATPGIEWDKINLRQLKRLDMETYEPKKNDTLVYVNVLKVCMTYMTMNKHMMRLLYRHAKSCTDVHCTSNNCYIAKYLLRHEGTCPYYDCPFVGLCYYVPEWIRSLHACDDLECMVCNTPSDPLFKKRKVFHVEYIQQAKRVKKAKETDEVRATWDLLEMIY